MNEQTKLKDPFHIFTPCLPLVCSLAASFFTILILQVFFTESFLSTHWKVMAMAATISACLTAASMLLISKNIFSMSTWFQCLFVVIFVAVAGNTLYNLFHFIPYGDAYTIVATIAKNEVFPRWFLGSAVLNRIFHSLWPTVGPFLPQNLVGADGFIKIIGAAFMTGTSIMLLRRYGARFQLLIPLLSPVWLLFCSGYLEYYPFIAWVYMLFLLLLSSELDKQSPQTIAIISSLICLSYGAFIPMVLLLIFFYGLSTNIKDFFRANLLTGAICVSCLILLWPDTLLSFFSSFLREMNLGETNILFKPYINKSSGPLSPFFSLSYAFSYEHIFHLCFMFFFGAGPILPLLFVGIFWFGWKKKRFQMFQNANPAPALLVCLILQVLYFWFMLPKLGPVQDIDLFFTVYLIFGFIAGMLLDTILESTSSGMCNICKQGIIASMLSSSSVILVHMLCIGFHSVSLN